MISLMFLFIWRCLTLQMPGRVYAGLELCHLGIWSLIYHYYVICCGAKRLLLNIRLFTKNILDAQLITTRRESLSVSTTIILCLHIFVLPGHFNLKIVVLFQSRAPWIELDSKTNIQMDKISFTGDTFLPCKGIISFVWYAYGHCYNHIIVCIYWLK